MDICHLMYYEKYINEYVNFVNENINNEKIKNIFIIIKSNFLNECNEEVSKYSNVILIDMNTEFEVIKKYFKLSDKIILHSLFYSNRFLIYLFFNREHFKKINWVIWGSDLYFYKYREHTLKTNIKEFIRKSIIKNIGQITCLIKGDYKIAQTVYEAKATYNYAFYPLPVDFKLLNKVFRQHNKQDTTITIQIGNSADATNEHIEILEELSRFKNENIRIVCPLSYGDKKNAEKVISYGKLVFNDKFIPLIDYLKPEDYAKILSTVDIAIFNHRRQQAIGNIIALIYLGKKVYIRSDITPWEYFKEIDIELFDTININDETFNDFIWFDEKVGNKNRKLIDYEFSTKHCVELWKKIFAEETTCKTHQGNL